MNFVPKRRIPETIAKQPVEAIPSMKGQLSVVAPKAKKAKKKPKRMGGMGVY